MVEVPSAAISSRHLLDQVAFASLGTNDLTQYTMAADRQLGPLAALNDPWQPAVLALIKATVDGAAQQAAAAWSAAAGAGAVALPDGPGSAALEAKPVGVCGEAAADPALAVVLVGLGVSTLSMTARALSAVSAVLRTVTLEQARALAELATAAPAAVDARAAVRAQLPILEQLGL
jgi:phosphotransferase system enzyme I (PtsI)